MTTSSLSLSLHPSIHEIGHADWNACAGTDNPFTSFAFLSALEDSGCVGGRSGWLAQHVRLRDDAGTTVAVIPCYAKAHSLGEYVFDHAWAQALERIGKQYYPKLQVSVPFTPVPGPRLLTRAGFPFAAPAQALIQICQMLEMSSVHVTFCTEAEAHALAAQGFLLRIGQQFHWHNAGYAGFDDFLDALRAPKRKAIRRERRDAMSSGLTFSTLRGADISTHHWDAFYRFYRSTSDRKWGSPYLKRAFFTLLAERLENAVVMMVAERHGEPIAAALNLLGHDALYGRNWGSDENIPFLHFELCYYRAIDFAIEHKLARVEAGAQGEHKIQRGYLPTTTWSAHWIAHAGLAGAVAGFLEEERSAMHSFMHELGQASPFRRDSAE